MSIVAAHPLLVEPLTAEAFKPFGDVISVKAARQHLLINDGNTERFHDLAAIDSGPNGRTVVSIFRGKPRSLPFVIKMMERHPLGSQAFMPLSAQPYLVVVAAGNAQPDVSDLRAFLAGPEQGVNYAPGVWHHPLLAINQVCDFLVIDRGGEGQNCDECRLEISAIVDMPSSC